MRGVMKSKVATEARSLNIEDLTDGNAVFEISATSAERLQGVTAQHLSKVWRISQHDASWTTLSRIGRGAGI